MKTKEKDQIILTQGVAGFYNARVKDRNYRLSKISGIVNHHFGIGDYHHSQFKGTQKEITKLMARLESNQIDVLISIMGQISSKDIVLDAGCGRGGTAITIAERFKAKVHGITISEYQSDFANEAAKTKGLQKFLKFYNMDYFNLKFPKEYFDHIISNESTEYAYDLKKLFTGLKKVLKKKGRYTIVTWCMSRQTSLDDPIIKAINDHYGTTMNYLDVYLKTLKSVGFKNIIKADLSEAALPYFELRDQWVDKSGVEVPFIKGFKEGKIIYAYITATKS